MTSSGISDRLWRLYAQAWLVCLLFPIFYLAQTPLAPMRLYIAAGGLVLYIGLYTWFMWPHPLQLETAASSRTVRSFIPLSALAVLVIGLSLAYGIAFLWLFVGLSAVIGVALSPRSAFVAVMVLTLLTLGLAIGLNSGVAGLDWLHVIPLVLLVRGLGLDMAGLTRLSSALHELHAARGELARRAAAEERLRLARDLHDLLGRTLTLITLKSELAGRLVEAEPARAAQEIREVQQEARQALREVREAVAGYRRPTVRAELAQARQVLEAAGIACTLDQTAGPLSPAAEVALAWAVREGVTNVIRHSRAQECTVRLSADNTKLCLEVINDGYSAPHPDSVSTGSGLAGLAERVAVLGGHIESGPLLSDGIARYRLSVQLAVEKPEVADLEEPL